MKACHRYRSRVVYKESYSLRKRAVSVIQEIAAFQVRIAKKPNLQCFRSAITGFGIPLREEISLFNSQAAGSTALLLGTLHRCY